MEQEALASDSSKVGKTKSQKFVQQLTFVAACVLLILGILRLIVSHRATTGSAKTPSADIVVTEDVLEPEESKPNEADYTVPADQPRSITLSTINARGIIQKIGLNKDNAIAVPSNVHFAGWYTGSVKPGDEGLSIIDGHVSGKYTDGIFKNLAKLSAGDTYAIEYGDKSTKNFEVVEVKTMPEKDSAEYLLAKRADIKRQLNLITCGGDFNKDTRTYEDRVIVISKSI